MTYPSEAEANRFTVMDRVVFAIVFAVPFVFICASYNYSVKLLRQISKTAAEQALQQLAVDKRLQTLEQRIYFPLFAAHARNCEQCGSDKPTEDGPPALCEEGFKLWQNDLRNNNK